MTFRFQFHLFSLLFLLAARSSSGQPPLGSIAGDEVGSPGFNPSNVLTVLLLLLSFLFLVLLSVYVRHCADNDSNPSVRIAAAVRSLRRPRGLPADVIDSFPVLDYSAVRAHRVGKGALECAVCLAEFHDDSQLRMLPRCSHVFHTDCIDTWLAAHVTCPVCRADLSVPAEPADVGGHVAVDVDVEVGPEGGRPTGSSVDRHTLRLPEHVRREILLSRRFRRSASSVVVRSGEGSSRSGYRWSGFFTRTLSEKLATRTWTEGSSRGKSGRERLNLSGGAGAGDGGGMNGEEVGRRV